MGERHGLDILVERCRVLALIGAGLEIVDLAARPELGDALSVGGIGDIHLDTPGLGASLARDLQLA